MKAVGSRLLVMVLLGGICFSWGFYGHKKINQHAVFALPAEMLGFYKRHIDYLREHAVDPDKRRYVSENEAVKHYIDIDHYAKAGQDPFQLVPKNWFAAIEKYGEDSLKSFGILPWNISWVYRRLVAAMQAKDPEPILSLSADLGHYLADAHVPLHTTENYNGQLSGQRGIHALWESRIPELEAESYNLLSGKAYFVSDPLEEAWKIVEESHGFLDAVLAIEIRTTKEIGLDRKYSLDERGSSVSRQYSRDFALKYSENMGSMVEDRMKKAILRIASYWFSAWVEAGQPKLEGLYLGKRTVDQSDSLETERKKNKEIKGRDHEG